MINSSSFSSPFSLCLNSPWKRWHPWANHRKWSTLNVSGGSKGVSVIQFRMLYLPSLISEWFSFTPMAHNSLPMPVPLANVKNRILILLLIFCLPACQSGFFKPAQGDEACLPCPINSRTTNDGATNCVCRNNYYRTDSDPIQMPCTSTSPRWNSTFSGVLTVS